MIITGLSSEQLFSVGAHNEVYALGVGYSGVINRISRCGEYQVWHMVSGAHWSAHGVHSYAAPWMILVKVEGDPDRGLATVIDGYEIYNSNNKEVKRTLLEQCNNK